MKEIDKTKNQFEILMKDIDFSTWYNSRPLVVQQLVRKNPWGKYIVSKETEQAFAPIGQVLYLVGYAEDGTIICSYPREEKCEAVLEHERRLWNLHKQKHPGKTVEHFHNISPKLYLNPEHLTPII